MIVIAAAVITVVLRKFKQPSLLTYIIAGVLIGPLVLGSVSFTYGGTDLFLGIHEITPEITLLSTLGVAFLLFSIGIETSIQRIRNIGKTILAGTILQVLIVIGATFLLTVPFGLLTGEQALFVGIIVAFSSTMVVVKILSDKNEINTLSGRIMVSILLLQDFVIVFFYPLLANISEVHSISFIGFVVLKSVLLIVLALVANRFIFPKLFEIASEEQELFYIVSVATAFIFIGISFVLEIPAPIGAFIGGLSLSTLSYNSEIFSRIRALRDFFLIIFFVSLGAQLSFTFGTLPVVLMAIIVALIFVIKPLVLFALTLIAGYGSKMGVRVGISLGQVSEFGFEIAGIGAVTLTAAGQPVLAPDLFSFIILITAVSMIVTPYLTGSSSRIAQLFYDEAEHLPKSLRRKYFTRKLEEIESIPSKRQLKDHIVIIGGGTVGRGLAKALMNSHQVLVLDYDPEVVKQGINDGLPYVYGTYDSHGLWDKLDLRQARLLVSTIMDKRASIKMLEGAKRFAPGLTTFALAHYFEDTLNFYEEGVDFVAMPSVMGSNVVLENILKYLDTGKLFHVQNFKQEYLDYLRQKAEEEKKYKRGETYRPVH